MNKLLKSSWERIPSNQALFIKSFVQVFTIIGAIQLVMNVISHDFLIAEFDKVAIFAIVVSMILIKGEVPSNLK